MLGSGAAFRRNQETLVAYEGSSYPSTVPDDFRNRPTKLDEAFELAKAPIDMAEANTKREDEGLKLIPLIVASPLGYRGMTPRPRLRLLRLEQCGITIQTLACW
jgi:hypothetical protein